MDERALASLFDQVVPCRDDAILNGYGVGMEERYWLRHPSLSGHLGPYSEQELRTAIEGKSLPRDSYVLVDSGQNETDRMSSPYWRPATTLLGIEPPAAKPGKSREPEPTEPSAPTRLQVRARLRQDSAYGTARGLISILAAVALLSIVVIGLAAVFAAGIDMSSRLAALIALGLEALGVIAAAAVLHAVLDLADGSLRRER